MSDSPWSGGGDDDDRDGDLADAAETLHGHLYWQLELARLFPKEQAIGRVIIDAINDDGYLTESLESLVLILAPDVEATPEEVGKVLRVVQQFDPAGVGARSLGECLELQLAQIDPETPGHAAAMVIAHQHLGSVKMWRKFAARA